MSMVSASRTQKRDKPSNATHKGGQVTAEEIRLAQIIANTGPEEDVETRKNVAKVMEVTSTTEENARVALYDSNNDTNRAIDLILENSSLEQTNEWETACRRKNKPNQNVRGVDAYDEDVKDATPQSDTFDKPLSKGRGRGRNLKGRGKGSETDRTNDSEGKGSSEARDRFPRERRGRGRGSYGRGGRRGGGGPPRRYGRYNNQNRGESYSNERPAENRNDFGEKFGTFTNLTNTNHTSDVWDADEDWGSLEVGTWSNDDAQKQPDKKTDSANEPWGTGSWNDDLVETQVFQSQNAQQMPSAAPPAQPNHVTAPANAPQMGERIDLGALFKKNNSDPSSTYSQPLNNDALMNQSGMVFNNSGSTQHSTPSVIQQLQQQGQSNSLFSDTKLVNEMDSKSRLFGAYERQSNQTSTSDVGPYNPHATDPSFSQYAPDKLMPDNTEGSASLLDTFGEQFKPSSEPSMRLSEITKAPYSALSQTDAQNPASTTSGYRNFSEVQQREATEAVKASLGLPPAISDSIPSGTSGQTGLNQNESLAQNTLSFGAPQPVRMKQRKKMPTVSKIPSSAVEMPGAGGGSFHELTNLQFGIDDSVSAASATDFTSVNSTMRDSGLASTQASMYNSNVMTSPASLINHMTTGNLEETSIFSSQLSSQKPQVINQVEATMKTSETSGPVTPQRYPESLKSTDTTLRGPPGITHPQNLSTSTSPPGSNLGVLTGSAQQSADLSSSGSSYGSARMAGSGNMPLSGMPHDSGNEASQNLSNQIHSYYTSSALSQQSQHMAPEHSNPAGRSLRSPAPSAQKSHTGTPSKDANSAATSMSSSTGTLAQTHMTSHVGGTPTKIQTTSSSTPISILGSSDSNASLGGGGGYGSMNLGYNTSSAPSASTQSSTPAAASPGKHLSNNDPYTSTGLSSSIHHNHQQVPVASMTSSSLNAGLGSSVLSLQSNSLAKSSLTSSASKTGPPNLTLGVPPLLPNQYGIPVAPGLMPAYTPETLYGYPDPLLAVQSRVHQMPNYYDVYGNNNPTNSSSMNREPSTTSSGQGKFGRGEPSSPTSLMGVNSAGTNMAQQQLASGQHNQQIKVSQSGAHQAQSFVNLPPTAPAAAYAGYGGLYYNAFQYPPTMFAAATAVPSAKHQGNTTAAFQQPATAFANAYSTSSINASSASNLHDLQGQGYNKNHVPGYDKQPFHHHHTNTPPPFNIQTLTAAMAAANTGAAAGGAPAMNPYTQAPFMTVLPTHQHSVHLHLPQHGDAGASVGSQRSQDSNLMGKAATKGLFGNNAQYWGN